VYPALTVLDALGLEKSSVLWVGSRGGMEETLVTRLEIPFKAIPAAGVHGVGFARLPGNIWKLIKGFFSSCKILKSFKPDVLFFTGGYVAFPMAVAGMRKPSVLYVPDIEPGLALKALARFADQIAVTTQSSSTYFPNPSKLTVTGYPIRPEMRKWSQEKALEYFGFSSSLPTLAVVGGSKGARSINYALMSILPALLEKMQVIHLTGHLDWETVDNNAKNLPGELADRYQAFPYLHEIGAVFAAANLIVSRAGASTLGEYPIFGLPAILVPYPYAWRYQKVNANYLAEKGAALILEDEKLENELFENIINLISDQNRLDQMSRAMASLAEPEAARKIAALLHQTAGRPDGGITV
jgi:UDP-N-acetylglucosamine--N-acetylmuramyl-(pentapeptide) pyrophosphoryl-undecaprenol N-acetylglucosamine transferase